MKSTPIIMQAHNVLAIANGVKTMTRRTMKPQPSEGFNPHVELYHPIKVDRHGEQYPGDEVFGAWDDDEDYPCRFGGPGDELWVREAWSLWTVVSSTARGDIGKNRVRYRADGHLGIDAPWRSPLFMPRSICRLVLTLADVRCERLQDITEADAIAEGIGHGFQMNAGFPDYRRIVNGVCELTQDDAATSFATLWDSINGAGAWEKNPWCWVLAFTIKENRVKADSAKLIGAER